MSIPKRHHYVPIFISRNFANDKGILYCYRRESGLHFETTPKNAFVERGTYTREYDDGTKSIQVEKDLSEIEGPAANVVAKFIKLARSGDKLELTPSEKKIWMEFTCTQFNRDPNVRAELRKRTSNPNTLAQIERDLGRPATVEERQEFFDPDKNRKQADDVFVDTIMPPHNDYALWESVLANKGLGAVVIKNATGEFVIGASPMILFPSHSAQMGLVSPEVKLLYPVSWDVMVGWGLRNGEVELLSSSDHRRIRDLNEMSFAQSTMVAGRSKELIMSLAHSTANRYQ